MYNSSNSPMVLSNGLVLNVSNCDENCSKLALVFCSNDLIFSETNFVA